MATDVTIARAPQGYGGLKPSGSVNPDGFSAHDAAKAWADNGAAEALVLSLQPEIAAYGAEQAKQAIFEYTQNAFADVGVIDGELCVLVDCSNNEAPYAVFWKLKDLLQKAIVEAENAGDAVTLRATGQLLEQLGHTFRPPVPAEPQRGSRALRQGAQRPSSVVRSGGRVAPPAS